MLLINCSQTEFLMLSSDILLACELTLIGTLARVARTLKRAHQRRRARRAKGLTSPTGDRSRTNIKIIEV